MENPCDPFLLGIVHCKNKKAGSKCTTQQFSKEPLQRYYSLSSEFVKILGTNKIS